MVSGVNLRIGCVKARAVARPLRGFGLDPAAPQVRIACHDVGAERRRFGRLGRSSLHVGARRPVLLVDDHRTDDHEQLSHAGHQRNLRRLAPGEQPFASEQTAAAIELARLISLRLGYLPGAVEGEALPARAMPKAG